MINMIIEKTAMNPSNFLRREYYYESAREGMFDLFRNMKEQNLIETVFLPGYIGWSPKEGSGIFDPINKLQGLRVKYYQMTDDLSVNYKDLHEKISLEHGRFAVLVVNYFGFIDSGINKIVELIKTHSGWIIEDNAHGFFTYQNAETKYSDATFFSLHKMFPFTHGGSLIINNERLSPLEYKGEAAKSSAYNPWQYDVQGISRTRRNNYMLLENLINSNDNSKYFSPLKSKGLDSGIVPQTFPIKIAKGNRDKIYELMNNDGYGVVSLYHTLIEPLRCSDYQASIDLSRSIMNLPVHQDVDTGKYEAMVQSLIEYCKSTSLNDN